MQNATTSAALSEPLVIILEFVRAENGGDPYAFRFAPQEYLIRGPRGEFTSVKVEWTGEFLADIEEIRRRPRRDPDRIARVGELLRRILEPAGWPEYEHGIADAVVAGRSIHVTLRSAAAELYALPWELLRLRRTGQTLGSIPAVLLRYEWPATTTAKPWGNPRQPGRVVIAWSAAGGVVPVDDHIAALRAAGQPFNSARDVLGRASFGRVTDLLAEASTLGPPIAVLHLLCHGAAAGSTFGLCLNGEADDDPPVIIDPAGIQQLLAPHAGMVRLVVIAACDGGNAGALGNRLGSVAQMLTRIGIAAVVASRYPLSVTGSVRMSEAFYKGLLGGQTLEAAFVTARSALLRHVTTLDWASTQLYARSDDGDATRIFLRDESMDTHVQLTSGGGSAPPSENAKPTSEEVDTPTTPWASRRRIALAIIVGAAACALALVWKCPRSEYECEVFLPDFGPDRTVTGGAFKMKSGHRVALKRTETKSGSTVLTYDCLATGNQVDLEVYLSDGEIVQWDAVRLEGKSRINVRDAPYLQIREAVSAQLANINLDTSEATGSTGSNVSPDLDTDYDTTGIDTSRGATVDRPAPRASRRVRGTLPAPSEPLSKSAVGKSDALTESAQAALRAGNRAEAETQFLHALDQNRFNAAALVGMCEIYVSRNSFSKAESYCERAIDVDPGDANVRILFGDILYASLRLPDAVTQYGIARGLRDSRADARIMKITAKLGLSEAEIVHDLAKSADCARDGEIALQDGDRSKAERLFHQAVAHDSRNAVALGGLSDVYFENGSYVKALEFAERGVTVSPVSPTLRLKLGDAYFAVERYQDARSQYEKAAELGEPRAASRIAKVDARLYGPAD